MTITAKTHIASSITRAVPYTCLRVAKSKGTWLALILGAFALLASCQQIVGFKDVKLSGDDIDAPPGGDDADVPMDVPLDVPVDMQTCRMAGEACAVQNDCCNGLHCNGTTCGPPDLFIFVTDASFAGNFGAASGARLTADIKCQDHYNANFPTKGCTDIHALIQVDDVSDTLARMDINFNTIPQAVQVKRITDGTPVSAKWDDLVNPNLSLGAPVSTAGGPIFFWSGRGVTSNLQCANWTSTAGSGNAGDATKVNSWTAQANIPCSDIDERLMCVCWN